MLGKLTVFILFVTSLFNLTARAENSLGSDRFWDTVEKFKEDRPEVEGTKAALDANLNLVRSLRRLEDPVIELSQNSRSATGQDSTVSSMALRQKLPFFTARTRQAESQELLSQSAQLAVLDAQNSAQFFIVKELYAYARSREEQRHLKERRQRLTLLRDSLRRTKASSPSQTAERQMISTAIALSEQQFDEIDRATQLLKLGLQQRGVAIEENFVVKWVHPDAMRKLTKTLKSAEKIEPPSVEAARFKLAAATKAIDATRPRPEFDLLLQADREVGGNQERNLTVGVAIKLPLNGFYKEQAQVSRANAAKARADLNEQNLRQSIESVSITQEADLAAKSIERFPVSAIAATELSVDQAEKSLREGWLTVPQFLELERQMHSRIEAAFDAQMKAVDVILRASTSFKCNARQFLGGSL
jgi:hypothetical protein